MQVQFLESIGRIQSIFVSDTEFLRLAALGIAGEGEDFDAKQLHEHSQQLLHFLRQFLGRERDGISGRNCSSQL